MIFWKKMGQQFKEVFSTLEKHFPEKFNLILRNMRDCLYLVKMLTQRLFARTIMFPDAHVKKSFCKKIIKPSFSLALNQIL